MHIFIDEAGSFAGYDQESPRVSVLGALIIEDRRLGRLVRAYNQLRRQLPQENGEVKGRLLDEFQIDAVICLLKHHGAIFEAVLVDLGVHTEQGISAHRQRYGERMTRGLTEEHNPEFRESVWAMRRRMEAFPLQLYVQAQATFSLVRTVIEHGVLYYCQRQARELEFFYWVVDAKGTGMQPTAWEEWWTLFIMPEMQQESLRNPFRRLIGGNDNYFSRFYSQLPEFLIRHVPDYQPNEPPAIDITKIMTENFRFSTQAEAGLELADIVTNATRRAFSGNLQERGWWNIPTIMIGRAESCNVHLMALEDRNPPLPVPWGNVARHFANFGRRMVAPDRRRKSSERG
jgi:hypothetical protein